MEIEKVAMLAMLQLKEGEKELFSEQMGSIINYIDKLNEIDTSGIEPTAHVLPIKNVFREDVLTPSLSRDKALQNAPERDENFYRVPKIID